MTCVEQVVSPPARYTLPAASMVTAVVTKVPSDCDRSSAPAGSSRGASPRQSRCHLRRRKRQKNAASRWRPEEEWRKSCCFHRRSTWSESSAPLRMSSRRAALEVAGRPSDEIVGRLRQKVAPASEALDTAFPARMDLRPEGSTERYRAHHQFVDHRGEAQHRRSRCCFSRLPPMLAERPKSIFSSWGSTGDARRCPRCAALTLGYVGKPRRASSTYCHIECVSVNANPSEATVYTRFGADGARATA